MDDSKIQIRAKFALLDDASLAALDGIGDGSLPVNESTIRCLARCIAVNARANQQVVSWIVRLNSVGSFVVT